MGGEKEDAAEGGAVRVFQVGGASVADVRWTTRREAVEAEETENPSRAKGEWPRAIGLMFDEVMQLCWCLVLSFCLAPANYLAQLTGTVFLGRLKKTGGSKGNPGFAVSAPGKEQTPLRLVLLSSRISGRGSFSAGLSPRSGLANA